MPKRNLPWGAKLFQPLPSVEVDQEASGLKGSPQAASDFTVEESPLALTAFGALAWLLETLVLSAPRGFAFSITGGGQSDFCVTG